MEDRYIDYLGEEYPIVGFMPVEKAIKQSDFVLVVGGDGTILHIASQAAAQDKPCL